MNIFEMMVLNIGGEIYATSKSGGKVYNLVANPQGKIDLAVAGGIISVVESKDLGTAGLQNFLVVKRGEKVVGEIQITFGEWYA